VQRSTLMVNSLDPSAITEDYAQLLRTGGVNCWHTTLFGFQSFADACSTLDKLKMFVPRSAPYTRSVLHSSRAQLL
jgi:hypothetical protein